MRSADDHPFAHGDAVGSYEKCKVIDLVASPRWIAPKIRHPTAADSWTWLVITAPATTLRL